MLELYKIMYAALPNVCFQCANSKRFREYFLRPAGQTSDGKIVEQPGAKVLYISGRRFLGNHSVNLLSSIITALVMPMMAVAFWPAR